ncbi:hypothetical protein EDD85DRAFT_956881 [Armillaria nabsnona]|nr:hypothetical protein EDD85DRAFT_956881 [Armillaria nabsnona]
MPRWSQHAEDSFRLPEGFKRIGYDADTMRYTFTDKHGKMYRSAPGEEYGTLTPVAFSASTDRPGAFSDGESPKPVESTSPAPKLTFSDFLPPSAMTSATSSLDHYAPAPRLGVVQSIHRTITSAYTKGSANRASLPTHRPPPPREDEKGSSSNTASPIDASVDESKSSKTKA